MSDRGEGEHALDIALDDTRESTDEHRQEGDTHEDGHEIPLEDRCDDLVEAEHRRESRNLDRRGHETGDGGRGARIHIRGPGVEGRGTNLEQEAEHHREHADEDQPVHARIEGDPVRERRDRQRTGEAVQEGRAHEEES